MPGTDPRRTVSEALGASASPLNTSSKMDTVGQEVLAEYSTAVEMLRFFQHEQTLCKNAYGDPKYTEEDLFCWAMEHDCKLVRDVAGKLEQLCNCPVCIPGVLDPTEDVFVVFLKSSKALLALADFELEFGIPGDLKNGLDGAQRAIFKIWNSLGGKVLKLHDEAKAQLAGQDDN